MIDNDLIKSPNLREILDLLDLILIEITNGTITAVNKNLTDIFSVDEHNFIGQNIEEFFGKDNIKIITDLITNNEKKSKFKFKINGIQKIINFKIFKDESSEKLIFIGKDETSNSKNEELVNSLLMIANATFTAKSIDDLYKEIHKAVSNLVDAKNFFISILNKDNDTIEFPYFIDEKDEKFIIINASESNSLTARVISAKQPAIFTKKQMIDEFGGDGELFGTASEIWLGVPLILSGNIFGAFAVQSYDNPKAYNENDLNILSLLSKQISIAINNKIQEDKLKLSEEKFKIAFYTSPDAIAINRLDDGMYVEINEGFTKITGYTREDLKGKSSYDINIWTDFKDRDKLVQGLKEKGVYENLEAIFKMKDGCKKYGLMSAKLIFLDHIPHILSITRDIDEFKKTRKQLEELNIELEQRVLERTAQIKDAMEELQKEILRRESIQRDLERYQKELAEALEIEKELNDLKSRFISMVSHEYRTPLTVIYTSTELLDRAFKSSDYIKHKKHLERIQTAVNNMTSLLEQVLFINRYEQQKLMVKPEKFNIIEFIYTIIEEMKMLDTENHVINFNVAIDNIEVITDKSLINQIMNNLISNALKYSPADTEVDIDLFDSNDYINIIVSDSGIGITDEDSDKVYDYFYRGSNIGNKQGTGLGLSIVKKAVEALKGMVYFNSEKNIGTSFTIKIPKIYDGK